MLNYDPNEKPIVPPEILALAKREGLHPINVICEEPGAKVGDHTGVSFIGFVEFVPRIGDEIQLDDGGYCRVKRVVFKITGDSELRMLVPNVAAVRVG